MKPDQLCRDCEYFVPGEAGAGWCHRGPPSATEWKGHQWWWPEVDGAGTACGEWVPKAPPGGA